MGEGKPVRDGYGRVNLELNWRLTEVMCVRL